MTTLTDYERDSGGHIGVYAKNFRTGAKVSWRARERFVMCSSFKASLAAYVLASVDRGQARMDELIAYRPADLMEWAPVAKQNMEKGALSVVDMCEAAVELSDNTCANALLARFGGPAALTGNMRRLILGNALSPTSRERLTGWMLGCKTGDNRLRAGLPEDWRVGDKTGNNGKDAFGDIAVTWSTRGEPVVMCAYTRGGAPTPRQVDDVFAGIGRYVGTHLAAAV
jgi:beta-lactamase class A